MIRKVIYIFIIALLAGCSVLPFQLGNAQTDTQKMISTEEGFLAISQAELATCPPACPEPVCPQPVCPQPVCPTIIFPTCPAVPSTITETPGKTLTPSTTLSPTRSSTVTRTPTITSTPSKTASETATPTLTITKTPTRTPTSSAAFIPQANNPLYAQNFAHPELGCSWMGIAGQVFDRTGKPLVNVVLVVEGVLNSTLVNGVGLTGANSAYGPGGYEIQLASSLINSTGSLKITLYNLSGVALSDAIPFNTYADCGKALVVMNFVQR